MRARERRRPIRAFEIKMSVNKRANAIRTIRQSTGVNGDHNGATCYDLRSLPYLLPPAYTSLSLSLSPSLPPSHCNTERRIELPTTAVTHDVVDALNQRWGRIRKFSLSLLPLRSSLGYISYDATLFRTVSRWNNHRRIALRRGANNDVPRLFGLLTARGTTFDRGTHGKRLSIFHPESGESVISILGTGSRGETLIECHQCSRRTPVRQTLGTVTSITSAFQRVLRRVLPFDYTSILFVR